MELLQLEVFSNLAKYEHMSVVAQILNISQPQVSRMLASLEAELGVKLFDRVGRNIALNEQGSRFLTYVNNALESIGEGRSFINATKNEILGDVRIGTFSFSSILNDVAMAFRAENPQTIFHFFHGEGSGTSNTSILLTSKINDHYEAEVRYPVSRDLYEERFFLVFSAGFYPELTARNEISLKDITDYPLVLMAVRNQYVNSDSFLKETLTQITRHTPQVVFECNEYAQKMLLVRAGAGLSLLPDSCLKSAYQMVPDLQVAEFSDFVYERSIAIARKPRVLLSDAENSFWDYLLEYYKLPPDTKD